MTVSFGALGALEAVIDGHPVDLGHARQRYVLAVLLAEANRPISLDSLAQRVWGDRPPHRAAGTLRSYLSRLRTTLAGAPDCTIERGYGTYVLRVDSRAVDLHRFRSSVAAARSADDDAEAAALFGKALALWRGEAFSGLDSPWLSGIRGVLEAERHAARLDSHDIRLRLGQHAELLSVLLPQADEHPFDERLAAQLILALYRCGRQADALDRYERVRRSLAESLGTDPGASLRDLHQRILRSDPALGHLVATRTRPPIETVAPARREHEDSVAELTAIRAVASMIIVAREGDYDRAARRMRTTTPALVREIGELQDEVGGALLAQSEHGVRLTELGERLRTGARQGVAELATVFTECRSSRLGITGRLQVGYVASIGGDVVARLTARFEKLHPQCRVTLTPTRIGHQWNSGDLMAEGDPDVVLHWSPGGDTRSLRLPGRSVGPVIAHQPRGVLVPDGHPLARRSSVVLEDLADFELIDPGEALHPVARDLWVPPVTPSGRPIRRTGETVTDLIGRTRISAEDMLSLVLRGYGLHITVVSLLERYPFPGLTVVPVVDLPPMVVAAVWRTDGESAAIRAFVGALQG
ncbi:BTAD domain-containing putative transcriptional regulator [Amycolatopsis sp. H20-H5]|uniref:BTAD domain-containing putative transcriptional regulator n=1 Tax=Amycolatopsis sp. H20-H5 TaxID=3046309 RepID=UPI002DBF60EB|nr:BTAD domain-containing putative transcriptional regulator [Amycolatopsis sp. H20-H5]MEC3977605.1 BTAD domain-containing putative transcriptional regulator [Amycolatopsis sp. H20-H5]